MKINKHYNTEAAVGDGGGIVTPNWSMLSDDVDFSKPVDTQLKEIKSKETTEEKKEPETPVDLNLPVEEKPKEDPAKPTEVVEEKPTEKAEIVELTLDEAGKAQAIKEWISKAKEHLGADIEEDSVDAFIAAAKAKNIEAEQRGSQTTIEKELSKINPEAQVEFFLLKAGYTRDQINAPVAEIDKYIGMSNLDIVKADLELRYPERPDLVEKELEILTTEDRVDHEGEKLKIGLQRDREAILAERQELAKKVATDFEANIRAEKEANTATMTKAFETIKDFMGTPLQESVGKQIAAKYAEGAYDAILNDPAKKAEFILFSLFGETAIKNVRNKALEEGREKVTKHLSNVPPVPSQNNAKGAIKGSAKTASGFEALSQIVGED